MATAVLDLAQVRRSCAHCTLRELCLPAPIGYQDLNRLDEIVRTRKPLAAGEMLFHAGMTLKSLYVVRAGALKTYAEDRAGTTQILGFHLPGEVVGFDALSDDKHQCHAEALEPSSVCEIPFTRLLDVAAELPQLQKHILRLSSRELVRDQQHLAMIGKREAQARVAAFLLSLAERYARLQLPADRLELPMSRADIANYLGLVIETVSRVLTRMAELGVIEVRRRVIRILDAAQLLEIAEAEEPCRAGVESSRRETG